MKFSSCSWELSGYSEGLQILPPILTCQILVVFELGCFFMIFSKKKYFLIQMKIFLKISLLLLKTVRQFSVLANFAFQNDCKYSCRLRDMTFFFNFLEVFKKYVIKKSKHKRFQSCCWKLWVHSQGVTNLPSEYDYSKPWHVSVFSTHYFTCLTN